MFYIWLDVVEGKRVVDFEAFGLLELVLKVNCKLEHVLFVKMEKLDESAHIHQLDHQSYIELEQSCVQVLT